MGSDGKYLVSQAQQIKARLKTPFGLIQTSMSASEIADALRAYHYQDIRRIVASWDDDRLGEVIGDAESVFGKCDLDLSSLTGRGILTNLAMSAMIYSIATLVWDEVQRTKAQKAKDDANEHFYVCKLCAERFPLSGGAGAFLAHLQKVHTDKTQEILTSVCDIKHTDELFWATKHP